MNVNFKIYNELKIGQYLDTVINDTSISFLYKGKTLHTVETEVYAKYKGRRLKGVIIDIEENIAKVKVLSFVNLHTHSGYSLLDGASHIEDIVRKTDYACALTDHGSMSGFLNFYKEMKATGKQPIVGFEAYVETIEGEKTGRHLVLLAKNEVGYKNLLKLTSKASENFYNKPHVSYSMLREHNDGVIATSACLGGEIQQALLRDYDLARTIALEYKSIFGDDFYLEMQRHDIGSDEDIVNAGLIKLSKETDIKIIATTDSHYTEKEDAKVHEILLCIQTGSTMGNNPMKFPGTDYHIHTIEEMEDKFRDIPYVLDNTLEIAEKCSNFELELGKLYMPVFDVPNGYTEDSYFEKLVYEGFNNRFNETEKQTSQEYLDRLEFEINIIKEMKYSSYFLIVGDFISYARNNGIMVGPGRGSAVGSLVSYCLGIIDLDPIPYGLLFERFLNPERVSMPDVDTDFCFERRGEVIDYIRGKYGKEAVSRIITFGTLGAKTVVRDVAKALDFPYSIGSMISKAIPTDIGMTLEKALFTNPELAELYKNNSDVKDIIDNAKKLEGLPRHASVHACGLALSPSASDNFLPEALMGKKDAKERTAQVTMTEVEELGILKMDLLGLRTMTVIGRSIDSINKCEKSDLKYENISLIDPYVYADISRGNTFGVFQLEGGGMRGFMKDLYSDVTIKIKELELKFNMKGYKNITGNGLDKDGYIKAMNILGSELFERLIAGISLYRPGPMEYIDDYIRGMKNPGDIEYLTPELEPILKSTYGITVYQEQVIQIVQKLAGYSLGRADIVRRAMGKKKLDVMAQEKHYFINGKLDEEGNVEVPGCIRNGISKKIAEQIWQTMDAFSKYAFNKSHAAGYAVIAVSTAWLKYYYPVDFMSETLNSFIDKSDKVALYLAVCKDMGIKILPPDINKSFERFTRSDRDIIFGLKGLKYLGKTSSTIVKEREIRGEFRSYQDLALRMIKYQDINKRMMDSLVYSGAVDIFSETRKAKVEHVPQLLKVCRRERDRFRDGKDALIDINSDLSVNKKMLTPIMCEMDKRIMLDKEKEYAGFYITEHPLDEYSRYFENEHIVEIGHINPMIDDEDGFEVQNASMDGKKVRIAGIVKDLKTFYTKKNGDPLKVFQLEGTSGSIDCIMFSNQLDIFGHYLEDGYIVIIEGMISDNDRGLQLIANEIVDIDTLKKSKRIPRHLLINIRDGRDLNILRTTIIDNDEFKGSIPLMIYKNEQVFKYDTGVKLSLKLISTLDNGFGDGYKISY